MQTKAYFSPMQWFLEAMAMPVAFAQVREDPALDLNVIGRIGGDDIRAIMIASGGCTAAAMVASGRLSQLHLVDANPAQLALCRLKLHLLQTASPQERAEILGHAPLSPAERLVRLSDHALRPMISELGPLLVLSEFGLDHCGRYEMLFAQLRAELRPWLTEIAAILSEQNASERASRVHPSTLLGHALDDAFDKTMNLLQLMALFGASATRNSCQPFSRHFAGQTRRAIASLPTADNPWLWQMLVSEFPRETVYPWLTLPPPGRMPQITEVCGAMDSALQPWHNSFDYVNLSNILDWLSPDEARRTLGLACNALRPGGYVLIRQLNSMLDIPAMGEEFEWLTDEARDLHARDRSFFYRALHLGRKPT